MTRSWKSLSGRLLFQDRGILPTGRMLVCFLVFSAGMVLLAAFGLDWTLLFILNGLFLLASLTDLWLSPAKKDWVLKRKMPDEMERGIAYPVELEIHNRGNRRVVFRLVDGLPQTFDSAFPVTGEIEKQSAAVFSYTTTAAVRGSFLIEKIYLRYSSPLRLWEKQLTAERKQKVKVIPDLSAAKNYLESGRQFLLYEGSEIKRRHRGGGEFAQVRNFVIGDDARKINWRQTAKLQEVMTNEYEPEHGKYVALLIDCGRMMGAELKEGNRLEKALEAALAVAAAALRNGDYVSVLAFSREIHIFVPPGKGMPHLQTILHAVYDLQASPGESNYAAVLNYLQTVQKKRSLILLFSDVQTFLQEESGLLYLKRLRQRHFFLMIGIEDEMLAERIAAYPETVRMAMVKSIAQQQLQLKKREKIKWEKQGLSMIEAKEERLAAAAVSHYIDIMNRGLL